jgi:hypothetical protein
MYRWIENFLINFSKMNIESEKEALIRILEQTNDEALIKAIHQMIEYSIKRDEEYLGISVDDYNKELDAAEKRIQEGNFILHEQAISRIKSWRSKGG